MDLPVLHRRHHADRHDRGYDRGRLAQCADQGFRGDAGHGGPGPLGWTSWAEFTAWHDRMGRLMADGWGERSPGRWRPTASPEAGVLNVRIPKAAPARSRTVPISNTVPISS
jgi:hypothetical protein